MFSVWGKRENQSITVYDVTYDAVTGYPQFLIYDEVEGAWKRVSAKYYEPRTLTFDDLAKRYVTDSRFQDASEGYHMLEDQLTE